MQGRAGTRGSSGALLAAVTAAYATGGFVALRADSAGDTPPVAALAVGGIALALLLWPLAARTTRVLALTAVLAVAQIGAQALTLAASGSLTTHGARAIVCCPPTPAPGAGPFATLTAQAGWGLFAAQLGACLVLALLLRGARRLVDGALDALADAGRLLTIPLRRLLDLLAALLLPGTPAGPRRVRGGHDAPVPLAGLVLARATARRGPPRARAPRRALPSHLTPA
ncbi:hypothetical protein [Motilibacter aurantiacus]|uniref:hypothetical protein n=1 Tax=Motilibacter aurantiacus TaxID=2714955 RepID=UPI00140945B9|nr:hypothetical protein [Motilibacter aurantiacus]NHC44376.1 hypothetical protein [Motilibacter aurantiacus]